MNTPHPCSSCHFLYYDVMQEDNPCDMAECTKDLPMGMRDCPEWMDYRVSYSDREKEYYGLTHLKKPKEKNNGFN